MMLEALVPGLEKALMAEILVISVIVTSRKAELNAWKSNITWRTIRR
jgi:hypothetical protein